MIKNNSRANTNLRFSFFNGIFSSAMTGFTQEYFTPFLLLLGASARQVSLLNAVPNFFAALIQIKTADITDWFKSRKKIVSMALFMQALMLLPMVAVAYFGGVCPYTFIILSVLFVCCGALVNPPWGSLLSDLVGDDKRGEYFGWRNKMLGFIIVASGIIAGIILHVMRKINPFHGFALLFGCACVWRLMSWYFLQKMDEPQLIQDKGDGFTLVQFLARIRKSNFGKFVLFIAMMSFSVNIASPFFSVLMLKELKFSYLMYTIITMSATLVIYLSMQRWGRHADKIGNIKVIRFTCSFIGIIPLLWIINRNPFFLLFAQIFSGFVWAGFNLCSSNFIYDAVIPGKRTRCIAYFNVLNGFALFMGSLTGGFILPYLPPLFGHRILSLFLISSLLRIFVALFLSRMVAEVRPVEKIHSNQLFFSMIGIRAVLGVKRITSYDKI